MVLEGGATNTALGGAVVVEHMRTSGSAPPIHVPRQLLIGLCGRGAADLDRLRIRGRRGFRRLECGCGATLRRAAVADGVGPDPWREDHPRRYVAGVMDPRDQAVGKLRIHEMVSGVAAPARLAIVGTS